jgi:hypothetical protein
MSEEAGLLYSFACELLAAHGRAYYILDENLPYRRILGRVGNWLPSADQLVAWLAQERFRSPERETAESDIEEIAWSYVSLARDKLEGTAQNLHEIHPQVDKEMWFYYLYCDWFVQALSEFDRVMQGRPLYGTEFFQAYQDNFGKFASLATQLNKEQTALDPPTTSQETIALLHTTIETATKQLASTFRETVLDAVKNELV